MASFDDREGKAPFGVVFDPEIPQAQIPHRYQVLKERARLNPCCYWREPEDSRSADEQVLEDGTNNPSSEEPFIFEYVPVTLPQGTLDGPVRTAEESAASHRPTPAEENFDKSIVVMGGWNHLSQPAFYVKPITLETILINDATEVPTRCIKAEAENWNQGLNGFPPCNGAMTECPFYTGPRYKYINDEDLYIGEQIYGEQIQELRFLSRDWANYLNPEEVWNLVYEEPDIFARAKNPPEDVDAPVAESVSIDGIQQPLSEMTRIHWDHGSGDVVTTKVISSPAGTSEVTEPSGQVAPPDFYTLIKNIGESQGNPIRIQFPPNEEQYESSDVDQSGPIKFTYEHSKAFSDIIYMAGEALPQTTLFFVNTTIHEDFPYSETSLTNNEVISPLIEDLVEEYFTENRIRGFRINKVDNTGFWQEFFMDINPGINKIVVLSQLDGEWTFAKAEIDYKFYHMEFIQQGYEAGMVDGQIPFITYIANSRPQKDVIFKGYQMGKDVAEVDSVYHFYVQERDLFRFCVEPNPNRRTFQYTAEEVTEDVNFFRVGRCNTYMCEITENQIPTVAPLGMDRSMEVIRVVLYATLDVDSGHGESEEVEIEMQVVPFRGRNIDGIAIPVRFFRVEPLNDTDIHKIDEENSRMEVTYFIFRGEKIPTEQVEGREEATLALLSQFQDEDFNVGNIGGLSIFSLNEETIPSLGLMHEPEIQGSSVNAKTPQKGDMSYVIQYRSPLTGDLIGRKWVYGVAEVSKFWARDIEIRYSWCSEFSSLTALLPAWRKFGLDVDFGSLGDQHDLESGRCRRAQCGDHETSNFGEGGPSFYPYDGCSQPLYNNRDVAKWIFQPVPDVEPIDEKYRAPDFYDYVTLDHHVFGFLRPDCFMEWSLGTINNIGAIFTGYSKPRGPITPLVRPKEWLKYIIRGWKLPPLGNRGREAFRIFKTMHYRQFIQKCNNQTCGFCVRLGWMPVIPFKGNSDFMVDNSPRTVFDQMYKEGNTFERKKWEEVFYIRNVIEPLKQGRPDQPVQWPRIGFHPNLRKPEYVWAWSERVGPLERGEEKITGITIVKPSPEVNGETVFSVGEDAFFRPIVFHPSEDDEDQLELFLVPERYSTTGGGYEERAYFKLGEEGEKLYFHEIEGTIEEDSGNIGPEDRKQIYAINTQAELLDAEVNPTANEIYTERVGDEGSDPPENLEEVDEYIVTGNLIPNPNQIDVFLIQADILGVEEDRYAGFFRALSLGDIIPKYLPREETPLEEREDLPGRVIITDYPDDNPGVGLNRSFSNIESPALNFERTKIFDGVFQWNPVIPGSPGAEQIDGFTITLKFNRRIMLSKLILNFESFGGFSQNVLPGNPAPPVAPSVEPSIRIVAFNSVNASENVVYEKPQYTSAPNFIPIGLGPVRKEKEFTTEFDNKEFYDRVEISVGPRNPETGFRITELDMSALFIKNASEIINVKEAKCVVEVQEWPAAQPFNFPAEGDHDGDLIYKTAFALDTSDMLELNGIAEFWQPALASIDQNLVVGTLGRIRRHWANGWDSADVAIHKGEISRPNQHQREVSRGGDVIEDHENRQIELMESALEQALSDGVSVETLKSRISDDDKTFYAFLQGRPQEEENLTLPYAESSIEFDGGLEGYLDVLEQTIVVSRGDEEPGWQAEGFWACLGERALTRTIDSPRAGNCNNLGGGEFGTYTPEWNTTHGVCGKGVGDPINSENPDYFGGISIGDLGFYLTRRLVLSGGAAGAGIADPTGSFVENDGNRGSVQDALRQDVIQDSIASQGAQNVINNRGLPEPPEDNRRNNRS